MKICEECFSEGREYGEVLPEIWLIGDGRDWYSLVKADGHKEDELLFFHKKPLPDPDPDDSRENFEESMQWLESFSTWSENIRMSPEDGYFLCVSAKKAGWKEGSVLIWVYNRVACYIADYDKKAET